MRRREFISLLGGVAAAWPISARAQRLERMRRIGVLMEAANDSQGQARAKNSEQALDRLGWIIGQNVLIDYRWGARDDPQQARIYAAELIALAPDAIVPQGSQNSEALQKETLSIPIIFVEASDPMSSGLVSSMSKPGRNLTGFTNFEFSIGSKWLEILREVAPEIRRALVLERYRQSGIFTFNSARGTPARHCANPCTRSRRAGYRTIYYEIRAGASRRLDCSPRELKIGKSRSDCCTSRPISLACDVLDPPFRR
jgi:ABC transporter substrate binding protein